MSADFKANMKKQPKAGHQRQCGRGLSSLFQAASNKLKSKQGKEQKKFTNNYVGTPVPVNYGREAHLCNVGVKSHINAVTVGGDNRGVDSSPGTMGLHTRTSEIITSEEDLSNIRPKMSVIDSDTNSDTRASEWETAEEVQTSGNGSSQSSDSDSIEQMRDSSCVSDRMWPDYVSVQNESRNDEPGDGHVTNVNDSFSPAYCRMSSTAIGDGGQVHNMTLSQFLSTIQSCSSIDVVPALETPCKEKTPDLEQPAAVVKCQNQPNVIVTRKAICRRLSDEFEHEWQDGSCTPETAVPEKLSEPVRRRQRLCLTSTPVRSDEVAACHLSTLSCSSLSRQSSNLLSFQQSSVVRSDEIHVDTLRTEGSDGDNTIALKPTEKLAENNTLESSDAPYRHQYVAGKATNNTSAKHCLSNLTRPHELSYAEDSFTLTSMTRAQRVRKTLKYSSDTSRLSTREATTAAVVQRSAVAQQCSSGTSNRVANVHKTFQSQHEHVRRNCPNENAGFPMTATSKQKDKESLSRSNIERASETIKSSVMHDCTFDEQPTSAVVVRERISDEFDLPIASPRHRNPEPRENARVRQGNVTARLTAKRPFYKQSRERCRRLSSAVNRGRRSPREATTLDKSKQRCNLRREQAEVNSAKLVLDLAMGQNAVYRPGCDDRCCLESFSCCNDRKATFQRRIIPSNETVIEDCPLDLLEMM